MRLGIVAISLLMFIVPQVAPARSECVPASGDPITLGAVFSQGFLVLDDSNSAYNAVLATTDLYNQCNGGDPPIQWQLEVATTYDDARAAAETLSEDNIPLVIGSGMDSVSDGLADAAAEHSFVFWDVTEHPRETPSDWSFAFRPDDTLLGTRTASYIQNDVANSVLEQPLRVALVVEDTPRAVTMADAVRLALGDAIVMDATIGNVANTGVRIRESGANVLLAIIINADATNLWFDMRQADANVQAWLMLGQDRLMLTRRHGVDRDTTGVMTIDVNHFALADVAQAISVEWYDAFLHQYSEYADAVPDTRAMSAAVGTHHLLYAILSQLGTEVSSDKIRSGLQDTSDTEQFGVLDGLPLTVYQQQSDGYCLLSPLAFATCNAPMQPFPTWRQRVLDNQ